MNSCPVQGWTIRVIATQVKPSNEKHFTSGCVQFLSSIFLACKKNRNTYLGNGKANKHILFFIHISQQFNFKGINLDPSQICI